MTDKFPPNRPKKKAGQIQAAIERFAQKTDAFRAAQLEANRGNDEQFLKLVEIQLAAQGRSAQDTENLFKAIQAVPDRTAARIAPDLEQVAINTKAIHDSLTDLPETLKGSSDKIASAIDGIASIVTVWRDGDRETYKQDLLDRGEKIKSLEAQVAELEARQP